MGQVLDGIRVVDFGQYLASPLAALLLADNGADVVRVDPPGGPRWSHAANATLQRGKRSIVLDLHEVADRAIAADLVQQADIVIENFRPGVMARFGLGPNASIAANAGLIYCSIPGFPAADARAGLQGWEGVVSAATGIYREAMFEEGPDPVFTAIPLVSSYAGIIAAHSIVAALIARSRDGRGQWIEASLFDAAFEIIGTVAEDPSTTPTRAAGVQIDPALLKGHPCADGRYVEISPPIRGIDAFIESQIPPAPRSGDVSGGLAKYLDRMYRARTMLEWERFGQQTIGAGLAPCLTSAEWLHDAHAIDSETVLLANDPILGPVHQAGYAIRLSETPSKASFPRRPLDADRAAIIADTHRDRAPVHALESVEVRTPALAGVKVIDTTQILAGPTAARILSEYGADVIKINNPRIDDNPLGLVGHTTVNAGKQTMLLDLKSARGHEVLIRLIRDADVFHQNFTARAAARLAITEVDVRRESPDIIYSSVNIHSDGGFRESYRGHEELGQAITGMQVRAGGPAGPPRLLGFPVNDHATGHLSALGIMLALYHRMRTGQGQAVQAALSRTGTQLQMPFMIDYAGREWNEPAGPEARGWSATDRLYRASDGWFYLAAPPQATDRLIAALGLASDLRGTELAGVLASRFSADATATWVAALRRLGFSAHAYVTVAQLMEDASVRERGLSVTQDHPGGRRVRTTGSAGRLSRTPAIHRFPAAAPGWHTREVLAEYGFGSITQELLATGIVAESPAGQGDMHGQH